MVGDLTADQAEQHVFGPPRDFGTGTQLLPAVKYFVDRFKDAPWGFYVFITDGELHDLEAVKDYSTRLARAVSAKQRNPLKFVLIGIGPDINEQQMEELDDLDTGTEVDLWDHKLAAEMRVLQEIFAEVVDKNARVSDHGRILDPQGSVVKDYSDTGLPAFLEFRDAGRRRLLHPRRQRQQDPPGSVRPRPRPAVGIGEVNRCGERPSSPSAGRRSLFPPVICSWCSAIQPRDHMGPPDAAPWLHRSLYDDYDATAMSLRGLNVALGRIPGAADPPCQPPPDGLEQELDDPNQSLKPRLPSRIPSRRPPPLPPRLGRPIEPRLLPARDPRRRLRPVGTAHAAKRTGASLVGPIPPGRGRLMCS